MPSTSLSDREFRAIRVPTLLLIAEHAFLYEPESTLDIAMTRMPWSRRRDCAWRASPGGDVLMGRHLVEADEVESAPRVVVIGESVWRTRFGSDPAILDKQSSWGRRRFPSSA